jgi:mxaA protein
MRRSSRIGVWLLVVFLGGLGSACQDSGTANVPAVRVQSRGDHEFAHTIGDLLNQEIDVDLKPGYRLDPASLPPPGAVDAATEIQQVEYSEADALARIRIRYQLFQGVRGPETIELPAILLRFQGPDGSREVRIDPLPVSLVPILPLDRSEDKIAVRPLAPPELHVLVPIWRRFGLGWGLFLASASYLLWVRGRLPWGRMLLPFRRAVRELERLAAGESAPWKAAEACRILHRALHDTAGEAVFAPGLERFLGWHPEFRVLRTELEDFFARSRRILFAAETSGEAADVAFFLALGRRAARLERRSRKDSFGRWLVRSLVALRPGWLRGRA